MFSFRIKYFLTAGLMMAILMLGLPVAAKDKDDKKKESSSEAAQEKPRREKPERALSVEFFDKRLDLDAAQEEKMQGLLVDYGKEQIKRDGEIRYTELEFLEAFDSPAPDFDKLEAAYKDLSAKQAELKSISIRKLMEAKQFLNDDQFGKYKKTLIAIFLQ